MTEETNQTLPIDQSIIDTIFANLRPSQGKLIVEARVTYWVMVDDGSGIDPTETELMLDPKRFVDHRDWWAVENELEAMRKFAHRMNDEVPT